VQRKDDGLANEQKKFDDDGPIQYALSLDSVDDDVATFLSSEGDVYAPRAVISKQDWVQAKRPNLVLVTVGFSRMEDLVDAMQKAVV
jgi:hypothetical protein